MRRSLDSVSLLYCCVNGAILVHTQHHRLDQGLASDGHHFWLTYFKAQRNV